MARAGREWVLARICGPFSAADWVGFGSLTALSAEADADADALRARYLALYERRSVARAALDGVVRSAALALGLLVPRQAEPGRPSDEGDALLT